MVWDGFCAVPGESIVFRRVDRDNPVKHPRRIGGNPAEADLTGRLRLQHGRELIVARHPSTGSLLEIYIDELDAMEIVK